MTTQTSEIILAAQDKTKAAFESLRSNIQGARSGVAALTSAFAGLSAGAAIAGLAAMVRSSINAQEEMFKLAQKTGVSVEAMSGLKYAAELSDVSIESLTKGIKTLSTNLLEARTGQKDAIGLFAAMRVAALDSTGGIRDADQVLLDLADRFAAMPDSAGKAALAVKTFGKDGLSLIPFLNQGRDGIASMIDEAKRFGLVITEQSAAAAEVFNDNLKRMSAINQGIITQLGASLLPLLNELAKRFLDAATDADSFKSKVREIVQDGTKVEQWAENIALSVAYVIDTFNNLPKYIAKGVVNVQLQLSGLASAFSTLAAYANPANWFGGDGIQQAKDKAAASMKPYIDAMKELDNEMDSAEKSVKKFFADFRLQRQINAFGDVGGGAAKRRGSFTPDYDKLIKEESDGAKKALEARLKVIKLGLEEEKQILEGRNKALEVINNQSLLSVEDYFEGRENAQAEFLEKSSALYQQEIAILEGALKQFVKEQDKAEIQGKLEEARLKFASFQREAAESGAQLFFQQRKSTEEWTKKLAELDAELAQLAGNIERAATLRFDLANQDFVDRLNALKTEEAQEHIARLGRVRELTIAQAQLTKVNEEAQLAQARLANEEARINIDRQNGLETEIGAALRLQSVRERALVSLRQQYDAMRMIAEQTKDPKMLQAAEDFRVKLEELQASANVLGNKLRGIGESGIANFLEDIATSTKTVSQAFKDMINSMIRDLVRLWAQNEAQRLMAGSGSSSGSVIGMLLSAAAKYYFGSSGSADYSAASGDMALDYGGAAYGDTVAQRAMGGPVTAGASYLVGERGPEIFTPRMGGTISNGGGVTIHNVYNIDSRADRSQVVQEIEAGNERVRRQILTDMRRGGQFYQAARG